MPNQLRIWHMPNLKEIFYKNVESPEEAIKILNLLADYDLFLGENIIGCNAQGLEVCDEDGETEGGAVCEEWYNEEGYNIDDIMLGKDKDE